MSITWGEIKEETLQKIASYSIKGVVIPVTDGNNKDYALAMAAAADAAQLDILRYKPIISCYQVTQFKPSVLEPSFHDTVKHYNEDLIYEFSSGKGYYFEVSNPATVYIESLNGLTIYTTITNTLANIFTPHKGVMDGFRIRFSGSYPYSIRNLGVFEHTYQTAPDYVPYNKYDIKALVKESTVERFIRFANKMLAYEGSFTEGKSYIEGHPSFISPDGHTIRIDYEDEGQFDVYYHRKPTQITTSTADNFVPEVWAETIPLMPLYIASVVFKDDDASISQTLYNEFAEKLNEIGVILPSGSAEYISTTGWTE